LANRCRHIETTAEHIAGMIDAPHVDVVTALWTDLMEHGARLVDEQAA
jgi:predicted outer membrane lipoprotein